MNRSLWLRRLRRWVFSRSAPAVRVRPMPARTRPCLEALEDRVLLSAQTFTVNAPGDAGNGAGTSGDIRFCINQANNPVNAGSTIVFDTTAIGNTITLTHGELEISDNMTIQGPGAGSLTITGNSGGGLSTRVFNVTSIQAVVTISGMTITGGNGSPIESTLAGNQGGDIFNGGNLTLLNDIVNNGFVLGIIGGPAGRGGGIFNAEGAGGVGGATLTLNNSTIAGNTAEGAGGLGAGGGIYNDINATTIFSGGSQVINNTAEAFPGEGGGVFNNGSLVFNGTASQPIIFSGNVARGFDGFTGGTGSNGTTGHPAGFAGGDGGNGGAAFGGGLFCSGTASAFTLNGVQFTGNKALGGSGGNGGNGGNASNGGTTGAPGGSGGNGGSAGNAQGGGIYNAGGNLTITGSTFLSNEAVVGTPGNGGNGGSGGSGTVKAGVGGPGGGGGSGTFAYGGALDVTAGSLTISSSTFGTNASTMNQVLGSTGGAGGKGGKGGKGGTGVQGGVGGVGGPGGSGTAVFGGAIAAHVGAGNVNISGSSVVNGTLGGGAGGVGGMGGTGGTGGSGARGGTGGVGGIGGAGGNALGGGLYNTVGTVTLNGTPFTSNKAASGAGGAGGVGGTGGKAGAKSIGGNGGLGGDGNSSGTAEGGAVFNAGGNMTVGSTAGCAFTTNVVTTGASGNGGTGGNAATLGTNGTGGNGGNGTTAQGGAIFVMAGNLTVTSSTFGTSSSTANQVIGGAGGNGGNGGSTFFSGSGGNGGSGTSVFGGGISSSGNAVNVTINTSGFTGNLIAAGAGGIGGSPNGILGSGGDGGKGGAGGAAQGGGVSSLNQNLTLNSDTFANHLVGAGVGGAGGNANPGANGGNGGAGGAALGAGVSFANTSGASRSFTLSGGFASNNQLQGGSGGIGGNSGPSGGAFITGGNGGAGGLAGGAGVSIQADATSTNTSIVLSTILTSNIISSGSGGLGGAGSSSTGTHTPGSFAAGGAGGLAAGGGLYNESLNATTPSTLTVNGITVAANQLSAGSGGTGGTGTTPNGGPGGNGGIGGNAEGGGLFDGNNTNMTVINSTFGGLAASGGPPNGNLLRGGSGGAGNNAGTPAGVAFNDGGNGGAAGSIKGGAVFVGGGTAQFVNVTIVSNLANSLGVGGAPGSGAGTGGLPGSRGAGGQAQGGGYFAGGGTNSVGNSIIDLNAAINDPDVSGIFSSLGNNILGSKGSATGFVPNDATNIGAGQLNLGPLQNNGGPTATVALQPGSVAINGGNNALITTALFGSSPTDQRGPGFVRIAGGNVDVGAFEVQTTSSGGGGGSPPPPPPSGPATVTSIVSVQNSYPGFVQLETVTAHVTNAAGAGVGEGNVTFSVNGQNMTAPVQGGFATVTFSTSLFDFGAFNELFNPHALDAVFSDPGGIFGPSSASTTVPAIWFDFFFHLFAEISGLQQFQVL